MMGRTDKPTHKDKGGRRIWKCNQCGLEAPWNKDWVWYGSIRELDDCVDVPTFCSRSCVEARLEEAEAFGKAALIGPLEELDEVTP